MTLKTRLPFSKYILWLFYFKDNLMKNSNHWVCQCVVIKTHICSLPLLELLPILILIIHNTCVYSKDPDAGRKKNWDTGNNNKLWERSKHEEWGEHENRRQGAGEQCVSHFLVEKCLYLIQVSKRTGHNKFHCFRTDKFSGFFIFSYFLKEENKPSFLTIHTIQSSHSLPFSHFLYLLPPPPNSTLQRN